MTITEQLARQWASQSGWEVAAVILSVAYVWLAARQSRWCWPSAFVSTAIFTLLFWQNSLPWQSILNAYYLLMAVYGWWQWQGAEHTSQPPPSHRNWRFHLSWLMVLTILSLLAALLAEHWFNAQYVYLDASVTVFSLFATYLVTQKIIENWFYWIVIDSAGAYLYWHTDMQLTGLLSVGYLGFSIYGYSQWQRSAKQALANA